MKLQLEFQAKKSRSKMQNAVKKMKPFIYFQRNPFLIRRDQNALQSRLQLEIHYL